jgi:hypothetical protein
MGNILGVRRYGIQGMISGAGTSTDCMKIYFSFNGESPICMISSVGVVMKSEYRAILTGCDKWALGSAEDLFQRSKAKN